MTVLHLFIACLILFNVVRQWCILLECLEWQEEEREKEEKREIAAWWEVRELLDSFRTSSVPYQKEQDAVLSAQYEELCELASSLERTECSR